MVLSGQNARITIVSAAGIKLISARWVANQSMQSCVPYTTCVLSFSAGFPAAHCSK